MTQKQIFFQLPLLMLLGAFAACASNPLSFGKNDSGEKKANEKAISNVSEPLSAELEFAKIHAELLSLKQELSHTKRNVQILSKRVRSGLTDDSIEATKAAGPAPELGFTEDVSQASRLDIPSPKKQTSDVKEEASPTNMLADAQIKIRRAQYGEAVSVLTDYQKRFPNNEDGGQGALMLAESWLRLSEFENVFSVLRGFYLAHPHSEELLQAKVFEGSAYEGLGQKEKAIAIYREIVSLGPTSRYAQTARASMQRIRDKH